MYELIEHKKLDAAAASITFSNIPQIYTDLKLVASLRTSATGNWSYGFVRPNGDAANSTGRFLYGDGSSAGSLTYNTADFWMSTSSNTANTFGNIEWDFPNYRANAPKSFSGNFVTENNSSTALQVIASLLWNVNDPITSLQLVDGEGNFAQFSSATLYGVNRTQALGRPKAIGGNITYANGYWVHTFTGSGTFYAQEDLEVDALIIAGGGAGNFGFGSSRGGGGGGAGGLLSVYDYSVSGRIPVIVGAGGPSLYDTTNPPPVLNGSNSVLGTLVAFGGGAGGSGAGGSGGDGGSGGGNGGYSAPAGLGVPGQGNNGFLSSGTHSRVGSGGGGAGAAATGQAGGAGLAYSFTGTTTTYSTGGTGGASTGSALGQSAAANTGGGGFGGGGNSSVGVLGGLGGAGGSGVVIVRYKA